jgi:hypothetical protein
VNSPLGENINTEYFTMQSKSAKIIPEVTIADYPEICSGNAAERFYIQAAESLDLSRAR